jgi:hypothetical protein
MEENLENKNQDPTIIADQSSRLGSSLNYTLDKQLSLAQKMFPDQISREKSQALKRLATQEFNLQSDMLITIRNSQKRILDLYTKEVENRVTIVQSGKTTALELEWKSEMFMLFDQHLNQVIQSLEAVADKMESASHERIKERAEKFFTQSVDQAFDSLEGSLTNFMLKINKTHVQK